MTSVPPTQPPAAPETDEWPRPGLLGRVKCSDGVWRIAFCVLGRGGSPEWVFADGARRRVDTSTAHSLVADAEPGPLRADLAAARERVRVVEGERDAAMAEERERIAQADRCGGCKGQGSHRRHCPRHPNYHPWIPLADRAESIGDSIGEPGLANQAWALAAAIRDEMPNHPYRPVRHREAR